METYIEAHKKTMNHKQEILQSTKCGCFNCLNIFSPSEIQEWIADTSGTATCPYCDIDAVIGDKSGYPITIDFLRKMKENWF